MQRMCDKGGASLKEFYPVIFAGDESVGDDFTQNSNSDECSDTDVQILRCTWVLQRKTKRPSLCFFSDVTPRINGA